MVYINVTKSLVESPGPQGIIKIHGHVIHYSETSLVGDRDHEVLGMLGFIWGI
jgi:hypothetical protein